MNFGSNESIQKIVLKLREVLLILFEMVVNSRVGIWWVCNQFVSSHPPGPKVVGLS